MNSIWCYLYSFQWKLFINFPSKIINEMGNNDLTFKNTLFNVRRSLITRPSIKIDKHCSWSKKWNRNNGKGRPRIALEACWRGSGRLKLIGKKLNDQINLNSLPGHRWRRVQAFEWHRCEIDLLKVQKQSWRAEKEKEKGVRQEKEKEDKIKRRTKCLLNEKDTRW